MPLETMLAATTMDDMISSGLRPSRSMSTSGPKDARKSTAPMSTGPSVCRLLGSVVDV